MKSNAHFVLTAAHLWHEILMGSDTVDVTPGEVDVRNRDRAVVPERRAFTISGHKRGQPH